MHLSKAFAAVALCLCCTLRPNYTLAAILLQNEPAALTLGERSNRGTPDWPDRRESGQIINFGTRDVRVTRITWIGHYLDNRGPDWQPIDKAAPNNGGTIDFEISIRHHTTDPRIPIEQTPLDLLNVEATYELLPEYSLTSYRFESIFKTPLLIRYDPTAVHVISVVENDPETDYGFSWNYSALTEPWRRLAAKTNLYGTWFAYGRNQAGLAMTIYGDVIPEPSAIALAGVGAIALAALRRRK
ncbi:PEP-CTERM sorting domain-containing protein [Lacipirellula parvula]|uniref:Ice-binding protein C-terminal domain-containing protein n=1 Tax=Lacipirellula parvula TaxID=2650471 RepID=A0A5K7X974_9BACT|nr:PEP-CTERM sorting domain-containing protein [Lacipirellula parvula]BBO33240.1 hypothetical protein PLANPX_2852 [Lacipirellula parvula]